LNDLTDGFVARNQRQLRTRQFAVNDVQVSAAYRTGVHANEHLARACRTHRQLAFAQGLAGRFQHHRTHRHMGAIHA